MKACNELAATAGLDSEFKKVHKIAEARANKNEKFKAYPLQSWAITRVMDIVNEEDSKNEMIYLSSKPGTGKTFINLGIAEELIKEDQNVVYVVRNDALKMAVESNAHLFEIPGMKICTYAELPVHQAGVEQDTWFICDEWYDALRKEPIRSIGNHQYLSGVHATLFEHTRIWSTLFIFSIILF